MTPDRFAQASLVSEPDYVAKTGLTIDASGRSRHRFTATTIAMPATIFGMSGDLVRLIWNYWRLVQRIRRLHWLA